MPLRQPYKVIKQNFTGYRLKVVFEQTWLYLIHNHIDLPCVYFQIIIQVNLVLLINVFIGISDQLMNQHSHFVIYLLLGETFTLDVGLPELIDHPYYGKLWPSILTHFKGIYTTD